MTDIVERQMIKLGFALGGTWEKQMTLTDRTKVKYKGAMSANYETKRMKQERWHWENQVVQAMLELQKGSLLDVPVGTGRFLEFCSKKGFQITGIDSSLEMLSQAQDKGIPCTLELGDATDLIFKDKNFDHAICIRFLDLIDAPAMYQVVRELCRVTKKTIICTIRFGDAYVQKVNTATHDKKKFLALIKRCGWTIAEEHPFRKQGWNVLRLIPTKGE
jgi:ubiquinone/menaquinone biosynthesis C-methylase UbiE